ncbi:hypothetical protein Taro_035981 [Colocasia esculenta]|uniref:Uncharacterized protein n=1 Tax=Colocasia esculenta TaxID=4460 RepID=A0A843WEX1_COLES|nr:hypothetical protein [Colocasia esculenta]
MFKFNSNRFADNQQSIDTLTSDENGSVDTSPSLQKTQLPNWDSVSTQPVAVSTLVSAPRRPVLRKWDSVWTHSLVVSTHSLVVSTHSGRNSKS